MRSASPCQPKSSKERDKYDGAIRNMLVSSSHVLSLSTEGQGWGYIALGYFLFLKEQINDIIITEDLVRPRASEYEEPGEVRPA